MKKTKRIPNNCNLEKKEKTDNITGQILSGIFAAIISAIIILTTTIITTKNTENLYYANNSAEELLFVKNALMSDNYNKANLIIAMAETLYNSHPEMKELLLYKNEYKKDYDDYRYTQSLDFRRYATYCFSDDSDLRNRSLTNMLNNYREGYNDLYIKYMLQIAKISIEDNTISSTTKIEGIGKFTRYLTAITTIDLYVDLYQEPNDDQKQGSDLYLLLELLKNGIDDPSAYYEADTRDEKENIQKVINQFINSIKLEKID